jgi:hypothetical protein
MAPQVSKNIQALAEAAEEKRRQQPTVNVGGNDVPMSGKQLESYNSYIAGLDAYAAQAKGGGSVASQVNGQASTSSKLSPPAQQVSAASRGPSALSRAGSLEPSTLGQISGIQNITLGQAPIVSQEGIQYQTPERGRDDMNVKERIADAWNQSVLGQKMEGAFGQQAFGVGNDQYQIRNKFFGIVGDQIPYSEASPQAKSEAMKAYFLGGITERPVGQTYEQAVEQTYEQAQNLPPIQLEALERLSPQQETTTTPLFKGLNPVGIGMGDGKEFSANTSSRGITPTSTFGGDLDLAARYADSISGAMGTPMTGMRPIDPNTGEPLSQRVIDIANRIGLQLPEASVPQAPMSPRDLAVAEQEARLERIRSGQGLSDAALIATGKMEAPEGYYDRPTEAPVSGKSTMTGTEQAPQPEATDMAQLENLSPAQQNFLARKDKGTPLEPNEVLAAQRYAVSQGQIFDPETGYSQAEFYGQRYKGQSIGDYLRGADTPQGATEQFVDPQGRLRRRMAGTDQLAPEYSSYERESAAREARLAARPDFMEAQPSQARKDGVMSMAQATKVAGGDRKKAAAMIELQKMGRDPLTGQPEKPEGMTEYQTETLRQNQERIDLAKEEAEAARKAAAAAGATQAEKNAYDIAQRKVNLATTYQKFLEDKDRVFDAKDIEADLDSISDQLDIIYDPESGVFRRGKIWGEGEVIKIDDPKNASIVRTIGTYKVGKALLDKYPKKG